MPLLKRMFYGSETETSDEPEANRMSVSIGFVDADGKISEMDLDTLIKTHPETAAMILQRVALIRSMMSGGIADIEIVGSGKSMKDDSLEKISEAGEGRWAADTALSISRWSREFVHGGDTMVPTGKLLEHILQKDECVTKIDGLRWHDLIKENMRLTASTTPFEKGREDTSLLTASFTTSTGRMIYVKGDGNAKPITGRCARNPVAEYMYKSPKKESTKDGEWHVFPLGDVSTKDPEYVKKPGITMSTAIDLVNYTGLDIEQELDRYNCRNIRLFLGVKDFMLPNVPELSAMRIRPMHDRVKKSPKQFNVVPIEVQFLDKAAQPSGGGIGYFAFPANDEALRNFEREHELD